MNIYTLFISILFSFYIISENNKTDDNGITFNQIIAEENDEKCMELIMYTWFIEFNKAQENGKNMNKADNKAMKKTLLMFEKNCK